MRFWDAPVVDAGGPLTRKVLDKAIKDVREQLMSPPPGPRYWTTVTQKNLAEALYNDILNALIHRFDWNFTDAWQWADRAVFDWMLRGQRVMPA